jgi:hypothetical protein
LFVFPENLFFQLIQPLNLSFIILSPPTDLQFATCSGRIADFWQVIDRQLELLLMIRNLGLLLDYVVQRTPEEELLPLLRRCSFLELLLRIFLKILDFYLREESRWLNLFSATLFGVLDLALRWP